MGGWSRGGGGGGNSFCLFVVVFNRHSWINSMKPSLLVSTFCTVLCFSKDSHFRITFILNNDQRTESVLYRGWAEKALIMSSSKGPHQLAHYRSLIRSISIRQYILLYALIPYRAMKALTRLRKCAVWSGPSLPAFWHKVPFRAYPIIMVEWQITHSEWSVWSRSTLSTCFSHPWYTRVAKTIGRYR